MARRHRLISSIVNTIPASLNIFIHNAALRAPQSGGITYAINSAHPLSIAMSVSIVGLMYHRSWSARRSHAVSNHCAAFLMKTFKYCCLRFSICSSVGSGIIARRLPLRSDIRGIVMIW